MYGRVRMQGEAAKINIRGNEKEGNRRDSVTSSVR
jgi:hypothetical protein